MCVSVCSYTIGHLNVSNAFICVLANAHACMYAFMCTHMCTNVHMRVYKFMLASICMCVYACNRICVCMLACAYLLML